MAVSMVWKVQKRLAGLVVVGEPQALFVQVGGDALLGACG
jgi:hypothetical protein